MRFFIYFLIFLFSLGTGRIAAAEQTQRSSPECSGGGEEAEALFQMALNYNLGIRGMPRDIEKAIELYEKSLWMGNPKAAINLGTLYRTPPFAERLGRAKDRYRYMNALYQQAIKMGCPDGYYFLALSYYNGWGVGKSKKKCDEYMRIGAEAGSLAAMYGYGRLWSDGACFEEAKIWLHRALDGGLGLAGHQLSIIYSVVDKNYEKQIEVLREGARLGDQLCLFSLWGIYSLGKKGQPKDEAYAESFYRLYKQINEKEPPMVIEDFDKLCPPRPVVPYSGNEWQPPY